MLNILDRANPPADNKVRLHFAQTGLERTAISTIYSHVLNPMIASRSYMSTEPIELWLDTRALRRGFVYLVDRDNDPNALLVQDSGMVPVCTQIAIVNPETCHLCHVGEYGEIWVQSEACAKSFYMSKQEFDLERFNGRIVGGDPMVTYVRTGDLGFLHHVTRPIGAGGQPVEMQVLFNLGSIGETFEVNGLNHFPMDIENSVEKCHRNITPGGSAVFQAGGLVVVLVEVFRKAYLASIVPVIVDAILNEHQLVVDMIAFVSNGDFPRSRLGEKQRGKILASWVTRKLRTIAQFAIRDPESADNQIMEVPEPRIRPSNPSLVSRSINTRGDMTRSSIVSESPAHMIPPIESNPGFGEGTVMSPDPISLHPNSPTAVRQGDGAQFPSLGSNATMLPPNDQPYAVSGATFQTPAPTTNDYGNNEVIDLDDDNRYYDPNADPFHPYGDITPQPSTSDFDLPPQNHLPRLSIANPSDPATYSEDPTPTTATTIYGPNSILTLPRSSSLRDPSSAASATTHSTWATNSPYTEAGNPYADYYNAGPTPLAQSTIAPGPSLASASTPIPRPTLTSPPPAPPPQLSPPPLPTQAAGGGRSTLPSQQQKARYSSYGSLPGTVTNTDALTSPPPPTPPPKDQKREEEEEPLPREALLYASRQSLVNDDDDRANGPGAQAGARKSDVGSVAGSVLRRYDGSGYHDGW